MLGLSVQREEIVTATQLITGSGKQAQLSYADNASESTRTGFNPNEEVKGSESAKPTLYQVMTKQAKAPPVPPVTVPGPGVVIDKNQFTTPVQLTAEEITDRAKAWEKFRKSYRKNEAMNENRELLKEKFSLGKRLGVEVNETRTVIKSLTNKIEQIRRENAQRGLVDDKGDILKTEEELGL